MLRYCVATSIDGFIATADGGVEWLDPYDSPELGFEAFLAEVGWVVLGRTTYEQSLRLGGGWPYPGKRGTVLTTRPLDDAPPGVECWTGDVAPLAERLRREAVGDVWLVGGGGAARSFLEHDLLDTVELFVIPVLLGGGVPLVAGLAAPRSLRLERTRAFASGVVELVYGRR